MEKKILKVQVQCDGENVAISDGFHTFDELYEHRITIYIALARLLKRQENAVGVDLKENSFVWRSKVHSDGSTWDGWFMLGLGQFHGQQITYHLPMSKWEETNFAWTFDKAPEFDGHSSDDVLVRLRNL